MSIFGTSREIQAAKEQRRLERRRSGLFCRAYYGMAGDVREKKAGRK